MTKSYIKSLVEHGFKDSIVISKNLLIRKALWKVLDNHFVTITGVRREMLGKRLLEESGSVVKYGFFKGMKLGKFTWGARDSGPMIMGSYEYEVQSTIMNSPSRYKVFIDIGAADGFYAIGLTKNRKFEKAVCFESNVKSQTLIIENAKENKVEKNIEVFGTAKKDFHKKLLREFKSKEMLFLIDIEGGEFEILDHELFKSLQKSMFVIEIHRNCTDFEKKYKKLLKNASEFFETEIIDSSARKNISSPTMADWPDEDRLIVFSEGRRYKMEWLVLRPKNQILR
jgi:hypothetical protein